LERTERDEFLVKWSGVDIGVNNEGKIIGIKVNIDNS
jgi:hypothetical protein